MPAVWAVGLRRKACQPGERGPRPRDMYLATVDWAMSSPTANAASRAFSIMSLSDSPVLSRACRKAGCRCPPARWEYGGWNILPAHPWHADRGVSFQPVDEE